MLKLHTPDNNGLENLVKYTLGNEHRTKRYDKCNTAISFTNERQKNIVSNNASGYTFAFEVISMHGTAGHLGAYIFMYCKKKKNQPFLCGEHSYLHSQVNKCEK